MQLQTYKIYINGTPVFLTTPDIAAQNAFLPHKNAFNAPYVGKKKVLKNYLDLLDKNRQIERVVLHSPNLETLWADFQSCFTLIEAAGGYVLNQEGQLLVFLRRGYWDLPKGKIDPGETPEIAAVREVQEETGLKTLHLGEFLTHTWHTYPHKGERILKKTWWYRMTTPDTELIPQTEEDIEQIEWVNVPVWLASQPDIYPNLKDVIRLGSNI